MNDKELRGLNDHQVEESRRKHGSNVLTPVEKESAWKKFLEKFNDPTIAILLVAAFFSLLVSIYEVVAHNGGIEAFLEPGGIILAVLLATGLAFYFEEKADKEFAILNQVNDDEPVKVIRNGHTLEVPKRDVVVGDLVLIETGVEVPADGELLQGVSLMIDESTLTGEPLCNKSVDEEDFDPEATFPTNHVMRGTKVMEGHGLYRVFAVGDHTENGKVFTAAQIDDSVTTPLNEQLDDLSEWITKISYGIAALVILGRIILFFTTSSETPFVWSEFLSYLLQTIMIAVTVVVVAVPEGLPMAVTLSLAYSMQRMLKTKNLVRKMHACETMGATTVICTDKTGTLTENQMQVYETLFLGLDEQKLSRGGDEETLIVEGLALNSTAILDVDNEGKPNVFGNPTEGALLLWLHSQGVDVEAVRREQEVVKQVPFSTERKYMATVVRSSLGKLMLYVKGAPEIILDRSNEVLGNYSHDELTTKLLRYQEQAMRTLGFAYREIESLEDVLVEGTLDVQALTFCGIVAIADPVRGDVPDAISECLNAGIEVKIVTGDTVGTAKEVARQIGLWQETDTERQVVTGLEVDAMSDEELAKRIGEVKVIARARPMDKKRLVEALQSNNEVVAVTGDGTNDAPALNSAHVGLSMGDGTAIAKEASDITILDNSFASISRAVMWGRSLYQNIQRFILFQMTVNVAACLIVLAGAFMGTESPLTVTQMLWVNLIMDTFAAMALASLPPSERVMKDQPRDRAAFIIDKGMGHAIFGIGGFFFLLLLALLYVLQHNDVSSMRDLINVDLLSSSSAVLTKYEQSLLFTIFVWLQFWNMFNARAYQTGRSAFHFKGARGFVLIALIIVVGQLAIVTFGGDMFNVVPLSLEDWVITFVITSPVMLIGELVRIFGHK